MGDVFQCWRQKHDVPDRIAVLLKDLIAFRKRVVRMREYTNDVVSRNASGYMSILYPNKGIDMVNIPRILNNRYVRDAVPNIIQNAAPPIVSFKYTKTIAGKIFNQKKVVEDLDVDIGTRDMCCECSTSKYCYGPAGHVITGDLSITKASKPNREMTIV